MICQGCKRKLPIRAGVHVAELEYILCTQPTLTLEPMTKDTWHRGGKVRQDVPFTCEGTV